MKRRKKVLFGAGAIAGIAGGVYATWHYLRARTLQRSLDSVPYEFENEKDRRAAWYMKYLGR